MPIALTCPGCDARLSAPDSAAGKAVKCSQCAATVPVPAADAGYEVVDAPRPVARAVAARPVRDAEEPLAARKPRVIDDEEDDDRPRKRRPRDDDDDDDEDYDRPRRGKVKGKKGGVPVWVFAACGGAVVFGAVVLGAVLYFAGAFSASPPPGWSVARDSTGGYRVFLPGEAHQAQALGDRDPRIKIALSAHATRSAYDNPIEGWVGSYQPQSPADLGTSPDQLYAELLKHRPMIAAKFYDVTSKTPVTLGGKPALEVRVRFKPGWMGDVMTNNKNNQEIRIPANASPELRKRLEESRAFARKVKDDIERDQKQAAEKQALTAEHTVYYVTTDGGKVYVLSMKRKGQYPDDAALKIMTQSFRFI